MSTKTQTKIKEPTNTPDISRCCTLPEVQERDLSHLADSRRLSLIASLSKMWVNGTDLSYYFFRTPAHWRGGNAQEQAVREAFTAWKDLGIGLNFHEVNDPASAMIRIGFDQNDGSWSYLGRDCVDVASDPNQRTTNFGWDLTTPYGRDTALHELGHVLGFPHEHQNPHAGIVWDESKVYSTFAAPPNNWSRQQTHWNIIRKIPANSVDGSTWDKDSVMHYQFPAGLIHRPSGYQNTPLQPAGGLSAIDIATAKRLYPSLAPQLPELRVFESQLVNLGPGEQIDLLIKPTWTRRYTIQTFGSMDTVMVLFEQENGRQIYLAGDDDSGTDTNSRITIRLRQDREYVVRTRLYHAQAQGNGAIMLY